MNFQEIAKFYGGQRVLVTGHTGFKGTWLCKILSMAGAEVYGYSLEAPSSPNIYELLNMEKEINSTIGDIRDFSKLKSCMEQSRPQYVFHLAAQPLVRESYKIPRETFETNVMGTVNVLECTRVIPGIRSLINITTDKVYENPDLEDHAFTEDEKLDGHDPYSNSKSCSELVTHSYIKSFFFQKGTTAISTARAGNVIGGGDFATDRIIPDCVRAVIRKEKINIRNPYSTRPYQHVLEPLGIYLTIVAMQEQDSSLSGYYNVGPDDEDCVTSGKLASLFVEKWGENADWNNVAEKDAPHESSFLKLDCTKLKKAFGWTPTWHIEQTINATVEWYKAWSNEEDLHYVTENQIKQFFK